MQLIKKTRVLSLVVAVLFAFGFLALFTTASNAASGPLKAVQSETIYEGNTNLSGLDFEPTKANPTEKDWDKVQKCVLVSVKSSNNKVLKAKKLGSDMSEQCLEPVKAGKAKITIKYKYKGKKYTITKTVKVKKYLNAIESITLNGKSVNLNKQKYRFNYDVEKYKKTSAKVKIKPASGWEINGAWMYSRKGKLDKNKDLKSSVFKKGSSISIKKDYDAYMHITLVCTSGDNEGDTFTYIVSLYR